MEEKKSVQHEAQPGVEKPKRSIKKCVKKFCKNKTNLAVLAVVIIALAAAGYFFLVKNKSTDLGQAAIKAKVENYVNTNLMQSGSKATVKDVTEEKGLYKVTLSIGSQDITTYVTKDGSEFFPQVLDTGKSLSQNQNGDQQQQQQQNVAVPKQDVPNVQLFVMSYCPYGTQTEKGIIPVVDALGSKIKFNIEFVDYSMHNDPANGDRKELDENLRQYCIEKNQPSKYLNYLSCFLKTQEPGQETACMASAGVDAAQVSSCASQTDAQYDVTKDLNDKSTWNGGQFPPFNVEKADNDKYNVQGSPTLVVNGTVVSPNRDPESLLQAICSGFNNQPEACKQKLSTTAPSPGFGGGTDSSGSGSSANCGS